MEKALIGGNSMNVATSIMLHLILSLLFENWMIQKLITLDLKLLIIEE